MPAPTSALHLHSGEHFYLALYLHLHLNLYTSLYFYLLYSVLCALEFYLMLKSVCNEISVTSGLMSADLTCDIDGTVPGESYERQTC